MQETTTVSDTSMTMDQFLSTTSFANNKYNVGAITINNVKGHGLAAVARSRADRVMLTRWAQLLAELCVRVGVYDKYQMRTVIEIDVLNYSIIEYPPHVESDKEPTQDIADYLGM